MAKEEIVESVVEKLNEALKVKSEDEIITMFCTLTEENDIPVYFNRDIFKYGVNTIQKLFNVFERGDIVFEKNYEYDDSEFYILVCMTEKCYKSVKTFELAKKLGLKDIGELSDGYHTFNELYEQRRILFQTLVKIFKGKAWKSKKHEDGKECFDGNWFIVGIDTPEGSYTYHYEMKYFDDFDCVELERGKHWDGHTDKDVKRLLSLSIN